MAYFMKNLLLSDIIFSLSIGDDAFVSLRGIEPRHDPHRRMIFSAGRESAVFNVLYRGEMYALKCYYNSLGSRAERSTYIDSHDPRGIIIHPLYHSNELWTAKGMVDVALYEWVDGRLLDWHIRKALHDNSPEQLLGLLGTFLKLATDLLSGEWRHGDLKTDNILIRPDGEMVLVDCDALYAPSLSPTGECGTPHWVHPARGANYDEHIDDYGIALLVVSLASLIADPTLYIGECGVAMPSLGNRQKIAQLLSHNVHLTALHEALYSPNYIINNLRQHIECIAHQLLDSTKPLF